MMAAAIRKGKPPLWDLRLYVADESPRSILAFANLKQVCDNYLSGRYRIHVIDVLTHPKVARTDQIIAVPTLVRRCPKPVRTAIGNMSDTGRLLERLDLLLPQNQIRERFHDKKNRE
jgi:circadian clock protein KaiB